MINLSPLPPSEVTDGVQEYFTLADKAYRNWTQAPKGYTAPYALHSGYHPDGNEIDQFESVTLMTKKIISLLDIDPKASTAILENGCGVGSISYQIATAYPNSLVIGTNITPSQASTANKYRVSSGLSNLWYILGDYNQPCFPDNSFNIVIFCESLCHSTDQAKSIQGAYRVLKKGGKLFVADVVLNDLPLTTDEAKHLDNMHRGWFISEFRTLDEFRAMLQATCFGVPLLSLDITRQTFPSARRMGENSAKRLQEEQTVPPVITESRKSCVALHELMKAGKLKYFWHLLEK